MDINGLLLTLTTNTTMACSVRMGLSTTLVAESVRHTAVSSITVTVAEKYADVDLANWAQNICFLNELQWIASL